MQRDVFAFNFFIDRVFTKNFPATSNFFFNSYLNFDSFILEKQWVKPNLKNI